MINKTCLDQPQQPLEPWSVPSVWVSAKSNRGERRVGKEQLEDACGNRCTILGITVNPRFEGFDTREQAEIFMQEESKCTLTGHPDTHITCGKESAWARQPSFKPNQTKMRTKITKIPDNSNQNFLDRRRCQIKGHR